MQNIYQAYKSPIRLLFNLKMKLTIALLFLSNALIYAGTTTAQSMKDVKIDLSVKNLPLRKVLDLIEKQTPFIIGYKNSDAGNNKTINIEARQQSVSDVLERLINYPNVDIRQISDTYILINTKKVFPPLIISGTITDKRTGQTMPGVSIKVKGTSAATQTDSKGNYRLSVPTDKEDVLVEVKSIGYKAREYTVLRNSTTTIFNLQLEEDLLGLDEVVVTGQGIDISKRRLSSNVVSISEKDLKDIPAQRIDQLLQSKLPNAQIKLTGGQAGATSIIRSRGVNSAFISSTPIIYVDGVRMDNLNTRAALGGGSATGAAISSIADIPMDNIEKIEFVNGGAATTLYGSDAANGVIQIITKKGGGDKTDITVETQLGLETPTTDFLHFKRTKDLLFENGFYQKHNLALNGGDSKFGYSFSGGFQNSTGTQIYNQNSNRRIDLRTGLRAVLGSKVTYESSFSYINNKYKRSRNGNQGGYTGLWFAESGASSITGPRFKSDLDAMTDDEYASIKAYVDQAEALQNNGISVNRFQTSQVFKYQPLKNLTFKATGGVDYRAQRQQIITTNKYLSHTTNTNITTQGSIDNFDRNYLGLTFEFNGQYEAKVNDFSFITTMGGQLFRNEDHQIEYLGSNIRDGAATISIAATRTSDEYFSAVTSYGLYLQENMGYKNKMFLDLGLRGDGNSAFGKNIGIQYYPKIGFSYIPSAENYFKGISNVLSSTKIRGNYGIAGNFPTPYANERTISFIGFNGDQAASFGQPGNPDLKPEKTTTIEAGIDLGFLNDRIIISGGFYHSITNDALFIVPPAPSSGQTSQLQNTGRILNRGLEFNTVLTPIKTTDYSLRFNLSINTLYNKVLSSGGAAAFAINGFSARTVQTVVQEGYPIGFIRGNYAEFNADGLLTSTTAQQDLGTTIPNLFGSMGMNFQYKSFNVFANADYQKGAYAVSFDRQFRFNYGTSTEGIPQAEIDKSGRTRWLDVTNRFVEKTDFIKVRTIGAGYSFKPKFWNGAVKGVNIGFSVVNPLNFSASSFDPEATISGSAQGQNGATTGGISYSTYSSPRQFVGSLRVNF
ncbi:outer membrane receptor protein involved in Fe transport [Pedobacter duraquae]|uniref:Outer membrane receptor protein involved in Fe transport n=2 Tax=Pedobacter duraquae TaxID=425511 RepID=A0A4R6IMF2_9SPHI|nr:outer membrane receptor protein involved in Fe transport [Pedobacter duraquae]